MKIFNLAFAILFVVCAALQYNDPDPYLWIPIYMYAAVLCFLAFRGKFYPIAYLVGMAVYVMYAIYLFFTDDGVIDWVNKHEAESLTQSMKAASPWIEDTREFFGLCILTFVLLMNYLYFWRRKPKKSSLNVGI
jgi:hypothetical protein